MNKFAVLNETVTKREKINLKKIIFLRTEKTGLKRSEIYNLIKFKYYYNKKIDVNEMLTKKFFSKK